MNPSNYDIAIIGGGIIGLATAMRLTQEHPRSKVVVLEKETKVAQHQTGHNSGVIHAGIYYAPGSQKANFCSTGGKLLRQFCDDHGVDYQMCGKLIVAVDESEVARLQDLLERGTANGAKGLELVERERLKEIEPHAAGTKAILSPNTGIIDYLKVSQALATKFREQGGDLFTNTRVIQILGRDGQHFIETSQRELRATSVINCAGLQADFIAQKMGVDSGIRIVPFRGEFFTLRPERSDLVNGLIYPVPNPNLPFLGVHFTKRVDGTVEAGPNAVLAYAREGYRKTDISVGELMSTLTYQGFWRMSMKHWKNGVQEIYRSWVKTSFVRSLQRLVPEVRKEDLYKPSAGVRAQAVSRDGELLQDFRIVQTQGSIHVLNAPSPAATSSFSISRHIVDRARDAFGLST